MSKIPVFRGKQVAFEVEVDDDMIEVLSQYRWYQCNHKQGLQYAHRTKRINGKNKNQLLHHTVLGLPFDHGLIVDHIDRNVLNCTRKNLRIVTKEQSNYNKGKRKGTKSKYIGVLPRKGTWRAHLDAKHIGVYDTEEKAAKARDYVARRAHGEFASLNFPDVDENPAPCDRRPTSKSGHKHICGYDRQGKIQYTISYRKCGFSFATTKSTLESAIEWRNQKLKELGVPIPD